MPGKKSFNRTDRIRKAIIREFNPILIHDVKDPELANSLISVTDVEVTGDLRYATIFVSIMGDAEKQEQIMAVLKENCLKIRYGIGQRIQLRHTPEVIIRFDPSLERGSKMIELLNQISSDANEQSQ